MVWDAPKSAAPLKTGECPSSKATSRHIPALRSPPIAAAARARLWMRFFLTIGPENHGPWSGARYLGPPFSGAKLVLDPGSQGHEGGRFAKAEENWPPRTPANFLLAKAIRKSRPISGNPREDHGTVKIWEDNRRQD